jgi:transcriptional regulator
LEDVVVSLADKFESGATTPWSLSASDPGNRARLRGIVGFELRSTSVQVKLKLNQNHPAANVAGVIAGLRDTGSAEAAAVADLMHSELDKR